MSKSVCSLAITPGEPAGIGPELIVTLAQKPRTSPWVVFADAGLLERAARRLSLSLKVDDNPAQPSCEAGNLTVAQIDLLVEERPGALDAGNAGYVLETLERAADACLAGVHAGVVTGPVQKSILNDAGIPFSGHTEFFCARAAARDVVMLLVGGNLRVALATTHLPLRQVADAITPALLERRLVMLLDGLAGQFGIQQPRVLVAGLNPHAGEGGHLGREEMEVITPVCERLRQAGHAVFGPLPADTLFTPDRLADCDAVMAMFHDQGLPVLKYQGFGQAVNVTLGLPFVRTSVDHGTALDLAGSGRADTGSFAAAASLAETLVAAAPSPSR